MWATCTEALRRASLSFALSHVAPSQCASASRISRRVVAADRRVSGVPGTLSCSPGGSPWPEDSGRASRVASPSRLSSRPASAGRCSEGEHRRDSSGGLDHNSNSTPGEGGEAKSHLFNQTVTTCPWRGSHLGDILNPQKKEHEDLSIGDKLTGKGEEIERREGEGGRAMQTHSRPC